MIETNLLRYAVAAADTGSFSRAAEQFNIKQSTLSKHVHYLELRLGLPIFRRSTRGVIPTDPGARFLARARRIVQDIEALGQESCALAKGETGVLRIGFHSSLAGGDLSAAIKAYRAAFPDVEIAARECGRSDLVNFLDRGALDVGVTAGCPGRAGIRSLRLWSEPVLIAMGNDHPMVQREPLYWTDLRHAAFLVTAADPGPDIESLIAARLSAPGYRPCVILQDVGRENLLTFVAAEKIAVIAGILGRVSGPPDDLVYREVHDAFGPTCLDQGVHWRPDNDNPALRRFLDLLSQRCGRPIPGE
jgi:DNA-binding transcriptional LysR family regulator